MKLSKKPVWLRDVFLLGFSSGMIVTVFLLPKDVNEFNRATKWLYVGIVIFVVASISAWISNRLSLKAESEKNLKHLLKKDK